MPALFDRYRGHFIYGDDRSARSRRRCSAKRPLRSRCVLATQHLTIAASRSFARQAAVRQVGPFTLLPATPDTDSLISPTRIGGRLLDKVLAAFSDECSAPLPANSDNEQPSQPGG